MRVDAGGYVLYCWVFATAASGDCNQEAEIVTHWPCYQHTGYVANRA